MKRRVIGLYSHQATAGKTATAVNLSILLSEQRESVSLLTAAPIPLNLDKLPMQVHLLGEGGVDAWEASLDSLIGNATVVLDAPPRNLLRSCDDVVLICSPESPDGLERLAKAVMDLVEALAEAPEIRLLGVLMTQTDRRLELNDKALAEIEQHLPVDVFPFSIPRRRQGLGSDLDLVLHDPSSRQSRGYVELTMEVLST